MFDPFRFDKTEIQSESDKVMIDRLVGRIEEFKDLGKMNWESIKNNRAICSRLQEAHNIMHDYYYPPEFLAIHRCKPCEMEALCAIKYIINNGLK
ncbi:MAG: hypothetical protein WAT16_05030 [Saprospiraceae bacterium]|nr:hypothetical protein [Saprospiraceae bacterium]